MKKLVISFLLTVCIISSFAQDTLRTSDLPGVGSHFVRSIGVPSTGMDPRPTGANHNWDYTSLTRSGQQFDTMLNPSATNILLSFFFVNSQFNVNRSNLAMKDKNFTLGIIGLSDVFNYYYNSSTSFVQPGFGAVIDSIPVPVAYTPHDVLYTFPMHYGNEDSVSYSYSLDLISTIGIYYQVNRNRHNEVDGWGVLSTPYGVFDVVRIKSTLLQQDSIYVDTFHLGVKTAPRVTYEYKWMGKGFGLPLLQINTNDSNIVSEILYQDSAHLVSVMERPAISTEPVIFPNPASRFVVVKYTLNKSVETNFTIFDQGGREVLRITEPAGNTGEKFRTIDLAPYELPVGNYFLRISSANSFFTKPLLIGN